MSGAPAPEPVLSPLHDVHERLGARFAEFAGRLVPTRYGGTLSEHAAVRTSAGVFDVSHLGRFTCSGSGATAALRWLLCNDVAHAEPGEAQYTMMLDDGGGVVDDIVVWRWSNDDFWVIPNGVNHRRVMAEVAAAPGLTVLDRRAETALIAVQGPEAPRIVEHILGVAPGRFRVVQAEYDGFAVWAAGTGYTGERGAELAVPAEAAVALFDAALEAGAVPCGLEARDVLRLEMGYPFWGRDLDTATTPLEAGFARVVEWEHDFVGRRVLAVQRSSGIPKRLICFITDRRSIPRSGYLVRCGPATGFVASGTFSPTLEKGIGMGYVSPDPGAAAEVTVEIRGRRAAATRVDPPFLER